MNHAWRSLEEVGGLAAVPAEWRQHTGPAYDAFKAGFLQPAGRDAKSFPCPHKSGCAHEVRSRGHGFVGVCKEDDGTGCDDIPLTADEVAVWEVNFPRLGRAIARALECDAKEAGFGLGRTRQIASLGSAPLPIVLTIQPDEEGFSNVVAHLVARLPKGFILLAPTSRFFTTHAAELLARVNAGFFDLESHLTLLPGGVPHARQRGGELFSPYLPPASAPVSDNEARRLFALLKALESESNYRKAPVTRVFQLYCLEARSRDEVAKACRCVPSLITLRLQAIEKKLGRKPAELRGISSHFDGIADALTDSRARHIDRARAIEGSDPDDEG